MENFSYQLLKGFDEEIIDKKIIALGKSQINLVWFFPYCLLYTLLTVRKWDIVYIGDSVLCGIGFLIKLFNAQIKTVVTIHGLDITYPNPFYQLYLNLCFNSFDKYICVSEETNQRYLNRGGKRSIVITNGVDGNKFSNYQIDKKAFNDKYKISNTDLVLLTVGRLVRRKGVAWFIQDVMPELKRKDIVYFVVGDGEEKEHIISLVKKNNLENQVRLLGRLSDDDLNELYINSDVFIMPNIVINNDIEGFGIVALEASLAGLIVIASGIEGIKDAVIHMQNGIIVESGNSAAYFRQIEDVVNNRDKYKKLSEEFSRYTKEEFSWTRTCKKYIEIFNDLVSTES